MSNVLNAFPILTDYLKEQINCNSTLAKASYLINNSIQTLNIINNNDYNMYIEDNNGIWNPLEYNTLLSIKFKIDNPNMLFDDEIGISQINETIGIAITWYCKGSNQMKTIPIGNISYNDESHIFEYTLNFEKGSIRNQLCYKIVLYSKKGFLLGEFNECKIDLEGDGSTFPIEIIEEKSDLLWRVKFSYYDIYEEEFNKEHICLYLNKAHKDFEELRINEKNLSPLFKEIISEFIYLFIMNLYENNIDFDKLNEYEITDNANCIANIVKLWIEQFNIDLSNSNTILKTIKMCVNKI